MSTIYTDTSNAQGLTAHILTATSTKASIMCYFESFNEMHNMVKEQYGVTAQHVSLTMFAVEMSKRNDVSRQLN